jgi:AAA+ ATPase superfamily predicted ATPase
MENRDTLETTRFVNIDDKDFIGYLDNQPIEFKAGEEKVKPIYVAKHCAKHLIDRILQEKHNIHNTLQDTPLRKSLMAKILPDLAEEAGVKPLSKEEEDNYLKKELEKQGKLIEALTGKVEKKSDTEELLRKALEEIEELKKKKVAPPK